MALQSGVGASTDPQLKTAAVAAVRSALRDAPGATTVLMFPTHNYGVEELGAALDAVSAVLPNGAVLAGGQVNGFVFDGTRTDAMYNGKGVAALALGGTHKVGVALVADPLKDPLSSGKELATQAVKSLGQKPVGGMIFTPGVSAVPQLPDIELLAGVESVAPGIRLSGTGFNGGFTPEGYSLPGVGFLGTRMERLGALLVTFGPDTRMGFAAANGMHPAGKTAKVTAADGPMVKGLDGKNARQVLLDMLPGDNPQRREAFERNPMMWCVENQLTTAVKDERDDLYWLHMPVALTPEGHALDFWRAPVGSTLTLVHIDKAACMGAVKQAGERMRSVMKTSTPDLLVSFSCVMRSFTLGDQVAGEEAELRKVIQPHHHLGLIANGEVGCTPLGKPASSGWMYSLFGVGDG